MAERICFISTPGGETLVREQRIAFKYHTGFALSQKRRSIASFHEAVGHACPGSSILEVSTKSAEAVGVAMSAFNLRTAGLDGSRERPLENVFQSSKVFELGGPYRELLEVPPADAKRDPRLRSSGRLVWFDCGGQRWDTVPATLFYDWLYVGALWRNPKLAEQAARYDCFTDIEFNPARSVNCQARSAAMFASLWRLGLAKRAAEDSGFFRSLYGEKEALPMQTSLFG